MFTFLRNIGKSRGEEKGGYERGKDYNHSGYTDLVINKIFGVEPQETGKCVYKSLYPEYVTF